jgi:hypothetical protein
MGKTIKATTLVWLRETPFDAGTAFAVADAPDVDAKDPVQIDTGTASLWLRQGKALDIAAVPPAPAKKKP